MSNGIEKTSWQESLVQKLPPWLIVIVVVAIFILLVLSFIAEKPLNLGPYSIGFGRGIPQYGELIEDKNKWTGVYVAIDDDKARKVEKEDIWLMDLENDTVSGGSRLATGTPTWLNSGYKRSGIFALAYKSHNNPTGVGIYILR